MYISPISNRDVKPYLFRLKYVRKIITVCQIYLGDAEAYPQFNSDMEI
jgi:hypothetical protein